MLPGAELAVPAEAQTLRVDADLEFVHVPEPDAATPNEAIFLRNTNSAQGFLVTVTWTASKSFKLYKLATGDSHPFSPWQERIRIPPGGTVFIGTKVFYRQRNRAYGDESACEPIERIYKVKGKTPDDIYPDPIPLVRDISNYLFVYKIDVVGTSQPTEHEYFAVNQGILFTINALLNATFDGESVRAEVTPGRSKMFVRRLLETDWKLNPSLSSFLRYPDSEAVEG
jgi:hypothetical protein